MSTLADTLVIRPFRNTDPPGLAEVWNRSMPKLSTIAHPLTAHELDLLLAARLYFDRRGLVVACYRNAMDEEIPIGFIHAGFGPKMEGVQPYRLDRSSGTVAMLTVDPGWEFVREVEDRLIDAAINYLRQSGAQVIYAGGRFPVNPFYWGLYGGSEFSGILEAHSSFHRAILRHGFAPAYNATLFESEIDQLNLKHPKSILMKRQVILEVDEDPLPASWWDSMALGLFPTTGFRLLDRQDRSVLASATTWDMNLYLREQPHIRSGLFNMKVADSQRRRGYGRTLLIELARYLRTRTSSLPVEWLGLQTDSENQAAIGLYQSIGFQAVSTSTLFRLDQLSTERFN